MKFDGVLDLARLPYFDADPEEGRLRLADRSIGPVIDMHTHLALAYVLPIEVDLCARRDERIVGFGSVHPYSRDVRSKLDEQVGLGARGIKVHPSVQCVRPDDPRAMRLYRLCAERDLPVLWHCGPVGIEPPAQARGVAAPLIRRRRRMLFTAVLSGGRVTNYQASPRPRWIGSPAVGGRRRRG